MSLTAEDLEQFPDNFRRDDAHLIVCIRSLLILDAKNALAPHGIGGHARGLLSAAMHRLAIQSRAAGVQGADELPRSENPDRKDFTVDEALRIADQNDAAYKHVPSVSRTLAAEVRRLATPQPPKDAGAVPTLKRVRICDTRPGTEVCTIDDAIEYGNAREAAGRADAVPDAIRGGAKVFIGCADAYLAAVAALGQIREGKTLFEHSPTKNQEAFDAWVTLNDTGARLRECVARLRPLTEPLPQHQPAEPAARAQATADDGAVELVAYAIASADSNNYFFEHYCDLAKAAILAHPSPAHAGSGDAEALAREVIALADEREQGYANREHGGVLNGRIADKVVALARRLAGGGHANS